jgi:hypothetical protein
VRARGFFRLLEIKSELINRSIPSLRQLRLCAFVVVGLVLTYCICFAAAAATVIFLQRD